MKNLRLFTTLVLTVAGTAWAGPLHKELVSADAKWLLHVDYDNLRATKLGEFLEKTFGPKMAEAQASLKKDYDFDFDWKKISAITAYGNAYRPKPEANGVLMIKTTLDLKKALDSACEKSSGGLPFSIPVLTVKRLKDEAGVYSINQDAFISLQAKNLVLLSKSLEDIRRAGRVLAGKEPNLNSGKAFSDFPETPRPFFFLGVAEGFNLDAPMPPQAKVLQMADGGRLVLGEQSRNLYAQLALKARSPDAATQIQQVLQGMIALASLSQAENKDLLDLVRSVRVACTENVVTLGVEYPTDKVIGKIAATQKHEQEKPEAADEPPKPHGQSNSPSAE